MEVSRPTVDTRRSAGAWLAAIVASLAVVALVALIAWQLLPHHASRHAASEAPRQETTAPRAPETAAAPPAATLARAAPSAIAPSQAPAAAPATSAPVRVPLAATVIAQVAANPESFAPSHVFSPPAANEQLFNYEPLPPFNSTTLKRTRTNPAAWELDAMHGPKMNDLGPEGAVHQAALVRDSIGNETPWYAIDSGPLAPAYAVMQGTSIRVMSRAFMIENRASLPADVAATLGKVEN